jgi:hypothetical protein
MISKPTVFVFGAGVSMPYGFPSGKALLNQIYEATKPTTKQNMEDGEPSLYAIEKMLREEFGAASVTEFGEELYMSQQASIDAFLEHRTEFMKIGKTAIALCLARKENADNLLSMNVRDKGCYQYLFQKMNSDWASFTENKVAFITFNYDRSLEEYLFTALKYTYGKTDDDCAPLINQIPITHVHGSLGSLPWQSPKGIPYTNKYISTSAGKIFSGLYRERMRDNIIVISEGQDTSPEFQRAFELMTGAERIYFLGFGYHPTNLHRLRFTELPKNGSYTGAHTKARIKGTALGMENAETLPVQVEWKIEVLDNSSDSLLFLRKYADLS